MQATQGTQRAKNRFPQFQNGQLQGDHRGFQTPHITVPPSLTGSHILDHLTKLEASEGLGSLS